MRLVQGGSLRGVQQKGEIRSKLRRDRRKAISICVFTMGMWLEQGLSLEPMTTRHFPENAQWVGPQSGHNDCQASIAIGLFSVNLYVDVYY